MLFTMYTYLFPSVCHPFFPFLRPVCSFPARMSELHSLRSFLNNTIRLTTAKGVLLQGDGHLKSTLRGKTVTLCFGKYTVEFGFFRFSSVVFASIQKRRMETKFKRVASRMIITHFFINLYPCFFNFNEIIHYNFKQETMAICSKIDQGLCR